MDVNELMQKKKMLEAKVLEEAKIKGQLESAEKELSNFGCSTLEELETKIAQTKENLDKMSSQLDVDKKAFAEKLCACGL